ncbi:MAG: type II toxin-antitoxin system HicA family toxin [Sporichthyaceae bacterium]
MKRTDLVRKLNEIARAKGFDSLTFVREGGNHTIFAIGAVRIPVARHTEIPENTARKIIDAAHAAPAAKEDQ